MALLDNRNEDSPWALLIYLVLYIMEDLLICLLCV